MPQLPLDQRLISGVVSLIMLVSPFGIGKGTKPQAPAIREAVVTVSADGEYKTIEEARDYVRTLDKSKYSGITVKVKSGEYTISEPIQFTADDTGTESCPVTYVAEDGVILNGGIRLTAKDFSPATGEYVKWFKDEAKANIVQLDLKDYGYEAGFVKTFLDNKRTLDIARKLPVLYKEGEKLSIARFPDLGEYAKTMEGSEIEGGENTAIDYETPMYIYYDEAYEDVIRSWHDIENVFVDARFSYTWVCENTRIISLAEDEPMMVCYFSGGHDPHLSTPFFWYNIPEELDTPGEYFIGADDILYLYKTEDFDTAAFTIPKTASCLEINNADYFTLDNFLIEGFFEAAFHVNADHFTMKNCTIREIVGDAGFVNGSYNLIDRNTFYTIGDSVLDVKGGDHDKLISSETVVSNNLIHDWGQVHEQYCYGLTLSGVGILATHNELYNSPHIAVFFGGQKNVFEYGYVHDVLLHADDVGAFASSSYFNAFGNTVRYSYIKNVGPTDPAFMVAHYDTWYPSCGSNVFYWDFHGSGQQTYSNVIDHVYGAAYHSEGAFNTVTNSLVVGCAKYTFQVYDTSFREHFDWGMDLNPTFAYKSESITPTWEKEWPELAKLTWGNDDVKATDTTYAGAPIGLVFKDNAVYYDRAYTWKDTQAKNPYAYDKYALIMSELVDDGYTSVNSKRDGYDIDELVKKHADLLGMTYEEFKTIGILPAN